MATPTADSYTSATAPIYCGRAAPAPAPAVASLTLIAGAASATVGVAATGWGVSNSGGVSGAFAVTASPGEVTFGASSGTVAPGATVSIAPTPLTSGSKSISLTSSTPGATVSGSPASLLGVAAPVTGSTITSLTAYASGAVTAPYSATVLPLRGTVPSGSTLRSTDDTTLRASILSTHDDDSAAVVVVSGSKTFAAGTSTISIQSSTATDTALTVAAVSALVSSVSVAFGGGYGTASITDFSSPERVWWANGQTICARYRVAAPTPGTTSLEAVIDIHAWAGRALVEVVVENGKFGAAASTSLTKPVSADYTATVSVNGGTIATVTSASGPQATHEAFRAWYARAWIGGDPGLRVTQSHTDLQQHPLLFKCDQASTFDFSGYAADAYTPWATGRHRATNMGGTGDHDSIGPLPRWESRALQSGDHRAWLATEVSTLAMLTYNVNHRDTGGVVPHSDIMPTKCQGSFFANWPRTLTEPAFECAHQPAAGLMAFIGRPSPVFIEIAQKIAVWTGTVASTLDNLTRFDEAAVGITDFTGIVGEVQVRSKAWGPRQIFHATFLAPDAHPWKASGREWVDRNTRYLESFRTNSRAVLVPLYHGFPDSPEDIPSSQTGITNSLWMLNFCVPEWHKAASARLLAPISGARQTALETVANGLASHPVRWVNEQTNGGWRFLAYQTRIGNTSDDMTAYSTWTAQRAADLTGAPSSVTGVWGAGGGTETTWAEVEANTDVFYPPPFWAALVAAVERGVSGAVDAWNTVQAGITNLATWRLAFAGDPRHGSIPKVLPPPAGFAAGAATGTLVGDVWTPARTGDLVNGASWAIVPTDRWTTVAGTRIDSLQSVIDAAIPGWSSYSPNIRWEQWGGSWSSLCPDPANSRLWAGPWGGHTNGSNNGLFEFSAYRMSWAIEKMPTDPALWDTDYKSGNGSGNATEYAASRTLAESKRLAGTLSAVNDVFYDEDSTGNPTGRHTYQSQLYIPSLNKIVMGSRRMWLYDLTAREWNYKRTFFDGLVPFVPGQPDNEEALTIHDEVTNRLIFTSLGSNNGGNGWNAVYDLTTQAWVGGSVSPFFGSYFWQREANCYARVGRVLYFATPPQADRSGGPVGNEGWYGTYNLDTGVSTSTGADASSTPGSAYQYAGGLTRNSFGLINSPTYSAGLIYVPPLNRFWLRTQNSAGVSQIYEIDHTTTPWTISLKTFANALPVIPPLGSNTMMWAPALNAVICIPGAQANAAIYRF